MEKSGNEEDVKMSNKVDRRKFIKTTGILSLGVLVLSKIGFGKDMKTKENPVLNTENLSSPWQTQDPFIFCAYHLDAYPGGNKNLGPNEGLSGRNIGQDFAGINGWNMYHGTKVPGFPAHPHSGFETVTVVKKGMVDHSDSLGATGRFGNGDVQWLTSGKGVQHAEMFPLLKKDSNLFELFQIWLNLPKKSKKVDPHYKMLWNEDIPVINETDENGKKTVLDLIAGTYKEKKSLSPTPNSWAADSDNHIQIWTFKMEKGATFTIPAEKEKLNRTLYFYEGASISISDNSVSVGKLIELDSTQATTIINSDKEGQFFFLQGRPINEPSVQYGPFVANTNEDLEETMALYRKTRFGGWPWKDTAPVNPKEKGRFAIHPGGKIENKS